MAIGLLALLALAGNWLNVSLFFGVEVLFGSLAGLLALVWLGSGPALLVTLVGGAYTWFLWDHPYALAIFGAEIAAVAWQRERARRLDRAPPPLAVAVALYWLFLGIPLVLVFYRLGLGLDWTSTLLIAVKQSGNGILNAALAGLVLLAVALARRRPMALAEVLFGILLTGMLMPAVLTAALESYDLKERLERGQGDRLRIYGVALLKHLEDDFAGRDAEPAAIDARLQALHRDMGHLLPAGSSATLRLVPPPQDPPAAPDGGADGQARSGPRIVPTATPDLCLVLPAADFASRMAQWRAARYCMTLPSRLAAPGSRLVLETPAAPVVDRLHGVVARLLAGYLVLALLTVLAARFLSKRLAEPLARLLDAVRALPAAIRTGQPRPPLTRGILAETGALGDAAMRMADDLAASFAALRDSEARYRLVVENLDDLLVRTDTKGRFEFVSPSYCRTFARSESELIGQSRMSLVHPDDGPVTAAAMTRVLHPPYACTVEQRAKTARGWRWLEWSDQAILDDAGRVAGIVGLGRDITERKEAELAAARRELMLEELLALSADLVRTGNGSADASIDASIEGALERIGRFANAERSWLVRFDPAAGTLSNTHEWVADGIEPMIGHNQAIPTVDLPALMARMLAGEPVAIPRVCELPQDWAGERAICEAQGIESLLAVPLRQGERLVGVVGFDAVGAARDWPAAEVRFLQVFAGILAGAIERERAAARIRASKERYDQLAHQARAVAWETDAERRYTYVSPSALEVLGYRPEELTGRPCCDLFAPEDREALKRALAAIVERREGIAGLVKRCLTASGRSLRLESNAVPLFAADGRLLGYRGIDLDVTERYQAQKRAEEREERLSALFDNAPVGMALLDRHRRVLLANQALGAFLGLPARALNGVDLDALAHPDNADFERTLFDELLAGHRPSYRLCKRCVRADGALVWGDLRMAMLPTGKGEPPLPFAMVEDITELHAATERRQALEASLSRYAGQLEEMVDLIDLAAPFEEQIRTLLGLACRSLGLPAAALGLLAAGGDYSLLATWRADGREDPVPTPGEDQIRAALAEPGVPCAAEREHAGAAERTAGFGAALCIAVACPTPDKPAGTLLLSLWGDRPTPDLDRADRQMLRLIAQRIAAARSRERAYADLAQARERETIGHLASGVAHDFNNLLGVIDANLYFLADVLNDLASSDAEIREVLDETRSALGQAKVVTSGMLSLSRSGRIPLEPVDLAPTVEELVGILRHMLPPRIALRVSVAPGLKPWANAAFLQSALLNLAINGRDAMPGDGVLTVAGQRAHWPGTPALAVGRLAPGEYAELGVADTGSGIRPEIAAHIFDPLFTTKSKRRGYGLGLYMVHQLVERSGAGLILESQPGAGTRFRLLLPLDPPELDPPHEASAGPSPAS